MDALGFLRLGRRVEWAVPIIIFLTLAAAGVSRADTNIWIKGVSGARTQLVNLEDLSDEELTALQEEFTKLRTKHEKRIAKEGAPLSTK